MSLSPNSQTHHLQPRWAPTPLCQPSGSFPRPLTPLALTSSTWAWVCCSLLLLVRFGGGAGGPPSPAGAAGGAVAAVADLRGRGGLRPRASSHKPRGQGSAHPPVHPSVPPFLLPGRKATDGNPGFRPAPPPPSRVTLSRAPSSPPPHSGPQFPRLSNKGDLKDKVRDRPETTGGSNDRGGRTPGPLHPGAIARAASPGAALSSYPRAVTGAGLASGRGPNPGRPPHRLPRAAAGAGRQARCGRGRPTHMAGAAGGRLGSSGGGGGCGGGGGGGSRWLRLALAARDGKMAAARHPHPGTAGGGGAGRRRVGSLGGGGGAGGAASPPPSTAAPAPAAAP